MSDSIEDQMAARLIEQLKKMGVITDDHIEKARQFIKSGKEYEGAENA